MEKSTEFNKSKTVLQKYNFLDIDMYIISRIACAYLLKKIMER